MKICAPYFLGILISILFPAPEAEATTVAAGIPDTVTVKVLGTHADSRFEPDFIEISPGVIIRFEVVEGLHTVTAYHPDNRRPLRIPDTADSFDSGILQKGDIWHLTLTVKGSYEYFCLPHERMGHTGSVTVK